MLVADFDYDLPGEAIAQSAIEPRDASRLLVTSSLEDHTFADLPALLRPGDLLVVNRTRVRAARLVGQKEGSGATVEVLLTRRLDRERWEALIRPSRRIKCGTLLRFNGLSARVLSDPEQGEITLSLQTRDGDVDDLLPGLGTTPLPPYFHGILTDDERYQTIFAKTMGSAAAPTAGLHFTRRLVGELAARGIAIAEIELEVVLDTFRPIHTEIVEEHVIHRERFVVPAGTAEAAVRTREKGGRVVAVGTTVVRALETAGSSGEVIAAAAETELFIAPGYQRRIVDAAITNFHAPRSTPLVMVAALLGPRWRIVYEHALTAGYRFLSFGDAMLIDEPTASS